MIIVTDKARRRPVLCLAERTCLLILATAFALGAACTAWGVVFFMS